MSTAEARTLTFNPIRGGRKENNKTLEVPPELQILEDGQDVPEHHHCFRILNTKSGDDRLVWDSRSLREVQAAKKSFVKLIKSGMTPYKVGVGGSASSEVMDEFDPRAEEVIFMDTALVAGG